MASDVPSPDRPADSDAPTAQAPAGPPPIPAWALKASAKPTPAPPPIAPPVIPPAATPAPSVLGQTLGPLLEGRLHPLTLVFALWQGIRNVIIPLLVVLLVGGRDQERTYVLLGAIFVGLPLIFAVVRYFTFTYRLQNGELITQHGLLGRNERNIPLDRVQDIRIEQGLLQRLLGVVDVYVETAGGKGAEASLSVLSRAEAERLRTMAFEHVPAKVSGATAAGEPAPSAPAPPSERLLVRQLSLRELVLAGMTSNHIASALVLVLIVWQKLDDILPRETHERMIKWIGEATVRWAENGGQMSWVAVVLGIIAVVLVGMLLSVGGSVVLFYGFRLTRQGEDLHRAYGLFTRRSSSLPRRRIQLLKIEETWLRRMFRLATLRVDTAGSKAGEGRESRGGRDVVLPIVPRAEVEGFLPVLFPDFDEGTGEWQRVSRRAIRRGTVKGFAVLALGSALLHLAQLGNTAWLPLTLVPVVYLLNLMSYRRLGYLLGERFFRTRRGWFNRATHIVPVRNAQAVVVKQTPLDRWHGVATLLVDTAGQAYTGGGPHIGNVPKADALALARTLAQQASVTRYRC